MRRGSHYRKRYHGDSLTGGTGDVNPQFINTHLTLTGSNAELCMDRFPIPLEIHGVGSRVLPSIEILKVYFATTDLLTSVITKAGLLTQPLPVARIGTTTEALLPWLSEAHTLCEANLTELVNTSGPVYMPRERVIDLTDGAGHGIVLMLDSLYMYGFGEAGTTISCKVLYRTKGTSLVGAMNMISQK